MRSALYIFYGESLRKCTGWRTNDFAAHGQARWTAASVTTPGTCCPAPGSSTSGASAPSPPATSAIIFTLCAPLCIINTVLLVVFYRNCTWGCANDLLAAAGARRQLGALAASKLDVMIPMDSYTANSSDFPYITARARPGCLTV